MSSKINAQSTNENILNIYKSIKDGEINLAPDFQRKLVWNDKHKENFIETILRGFPFPEIYIADGEIDLENPTQVTKWIVDGQQRLNAIVQYLDNDEKLVLSSIPHFKDLSDDKKREFYYYNVVIRNLGHLDKENIQEVFKRINSVNYALNAVEIENALYDGEFISTANEILEKNSTIIERLGIFNFNDESRMKDLEFILTLMSLIEEKGYFTSTQRNEFYIKNYNDTYPHKEDIKSKLHNLFSCTDKIITDAYSIWCKKSNFLTLIIELDRFNQTHSLVGNEKKIKAILSSLENEIINNKETSTENNAFHEYYISSIQGTGGKSARIKRGKILQQYLIDNFN